tara:strand:+ start:1027 stop:1191 length:165 start_codon:yes stop_codon:yes gene_type:complete
MNKELTESLARGSIYLEKFAVEFATNFLDGVRYSIPLACGGFPVWGAILLWGMM